MKGPPEVALGDLIRAVTHLGLTQRAEIREAALALGLPVGARAAAPRDQVIRPEAASASAVAGFPEIVHADAETAPSGRGSGAAIPAPGTDLLVRNEGRVPPVAPAWARSAAALQPAEAVLPAPPPPLLSPPTTRALLAALVCGEAASGPLDVERAVAVLASGRALAEIPRLRLPTLRHGVQILVDRGAALLPYREDQHRVVADLRSLLAPDRVQVLHFAGNPLRTGPTTPRTWRRYSPPAAGCTVLVLSDLGLCRGEDLVEAAPAAIWVEFARRVRRAGARVAALVPYDARRWPAALRGRMHLVAWDRFTTVARARIRRESGRGRGAVR